MKIRKFLGALLASATIAAAGIVATIQPAAAASLPPQGATLCSSTSRCGISMPVYDPNGERRQGTKFRVDVTGQKGKTVKVRAFGIRYTGTGSGQYEYVPISEPVSVTPTGGASVTFGSASVWLTVTLPPAGVTGETVFVQTEDFVKGNNIVPSYYYTADGSHGELEEVEVLTFRGSDNGFAETTFSNGVFNRKVGSAYPGDKYSVQVLYNGKWATIDNPDVTPAVASSTGIAIIGGVVPDYLPTGRYRTRVVNTTRGLTDLSPDFPYTYFTRTRTPQPGDADFDVYTQPGTWEVNGRHWRTRCEKYSTTERCFTDLWTTTVQLVNGRYVQQNGWLFNNLTYKPIARSAYKGNPIGGNGVAGYNSPYTSGGRQWRTECDTAATGRGGCRSYIMTTVVEAYKTSSGTTAYRSVNKWMLNNIVRFS